MVGHSLVGEEIFTLFLDQPCTSISTDTLISAISAVLGADPLSLTLLSEGVPLEPDQIHGYAHMASRFAFWGSKRHLIWHTITRAGACWN